MKKKISILIILAFAFSCSPKESPSGGSTDVTEAVVTLTSTPTPVLGAEGGSVDVTFTATDAWKAMPINNRADGWLSLSPESGSKGNGKVTLTATANDTGDERSATIKIWAGGVSAQVTLTQKQADALVVSASKTQLGKEAGSFTVTVRTNIEFTYEIEMGADWLHEAGTKAITSHKLTFSVDANEDTAPREGRIAISSSLGKETVTVYQEATSPTLILGAGSFELESTGGTFSVDVTHNVEVDMSIPGQADWITPVVTKSMSTDRYTFSASENTSTAAREADILFTSSAAGLSQKVHVTQKGKSSQEMGLPGVYGLMGLEWNYVKGQHQLLEVDTGYSNQYVFMNPANNKFVSITVYGYMMMGSTHSVNILQNVNPAVDGYIENVDLTVDKEENGVYWLSSNSNPAEKVILGLPAQ